MLKTLWYIAFATMIKWIILGNKSSALKERTLMQNKIVSFRHYLGLH